MARLPEDDLVLIGDVVDVVQVAGRRRRPIRLLVVLVVLGGFGWMVSRYVASRKRRALPADAVTTTAPGPAEAPDGEAAPDPVTSANGSGAAVTDAAASDATSE